jgi:hypothetical protein
MASLPPGRRDDTKEEPMRTASLRRLGGACAVLVSTLAGMACFHDPTVEPTRVEYADEVGSLRVSVLGVAPWSEYRDALQPKFDLKPEQTLAQVVPTTQLLQQKYLEALYAQLKVALPTTGETSVERTLPTGEPAADPGSVTRETRPGDASTVPLQASPFGGRTAAGLPSPTNFLDQSIQKDPMLGYWAATALYQEVKLIDAYLEHAAIRELDHDAYIVRVQVGLMPRTRYMPYDAYANLSFFRGKGSTCKELPQVVPLLVTDNLEATMHSSSVERMQQLALAVSGMWQGVAAQGEVQRLRDAIETLVGRDLNSLLTTSRLAPNALRIRLGAQAGGDVRWALVPRTHNVTFVLLMPKECNGKVTAENGTRHASMWATSEFIDAESGKRIAGKSPKQESRDVKRVNELFELPSDFDWDEAWWDVVQSDWESFEKHVHCECFRHGLPSPESQCEGAAPCFGHWSLWAARAASRTCKKEGFDELQQAWTEMVALQGSYSVDAVDVELPKPPSLVRPPPQVALLLDDTKSATSVTVRGGSGLQAGRLCAGLRLAGGGVDRILPATSLTVVERGSAVQLGFPSLGAWGLAEAAKSPGTELRLASDASAQTCWAAVTSGAGTDLWRSQGVAYVAAPTPAEPGFELALSTGVIIASADGSGAAKLIVKASPKNPAQKAVLTVTGADVTRATIAGAPLVPAANTIAVVLDAKEKQVELGLGNLAAGSKLTIAAANEKQVQLKPIELEVRAAPPEKKKES